MNRHSGDDVQPISIERSNIFKVFDLNQGLAFVISNYEASAKASESLLLEQIFRGMIFRTIL